MISIKKRSMLSGFRQRFKAILGVGVLSFILIGATLSQTAQAENPPWPTTNPAPICGNTELLAGPITAPEGAVIVPAGSNVGFNFNQPGATFWFETGTHTLGDDEFGQIIARANTTYIGAPDAILDGQNKNKYAFTGDAANVTVKHLTIKNFGRGNDNNNEGVVNHDSGSNWTIQYNTITNNDGAGVFLGSNNTVSYNCLKDNGQYGFSMFKMPVEGDSAIKNIVLDHNEIAGNNTDNWEAQIEGCGCTGGGKFWDVEGARVTNNWVHHNKSTGLWADTNNIDFLFEGNYIEQNDGEGIWYEISYNATIRGNTIRRNAWVSGQNNTGSPGPAIYLSESGGDARLASTVSGAPQIRIYNNNFEDNFSGVSIYENSNRFCNSNGNTSKGYCTPLTTPTLLNPDEAARNYEYPNPITQDHPCYTNVANEPYKTDCRWHAKNIEVFNNDFRFDDSVVPCAGTFCGAQALYATGADNMPWSPYTVSEIQNNVMFNNNNSFHDNHYFGNWKFAKGYGETLSFNNWRAAPFNQDAGSTFTGDPAAGTSTGGSGGGSPSTPPATIANDLDADTSSLEGSIGKWQNWYSASISQTSAEAHSGTHSLKISVTDPWGWGVELSNWPGFATTAGTKTISFWGKLGTGTNIQPKMQVKWLASDYSLLQTDEVALPALTSTWQKVSSLVEAPAGSTTALVSLRGTGNPGDIVYLDDMIVGNASNLVDTDTSSFEANAGQWGSWYSANVAQSTEQAQQGVGSLKISITDPWGWAAQLNNWPGYTATPGDKRITYWAKQGAGNISNLTLRVKWLDTNQATLQTDTVPLSLSPLWQKGTADVTAPVGTVSAYIDISSESGNPTDNLYLDTIGIFDK